MVKKIIWWKNLFSDSSHSDNILKWSEQDYLLYWLDMGDFWIKSWINKPKILYTVFPYIYPIQNFNFRIFLHIIPFSPYRTIVFSSYLWKLLIIFWFANWFQPQGQADRTEVTIPQHTSGIFILNQTFLFIF